MEEEKTEKSGLSGRPLDAKRVFRPAKKGAWHLQAQTEYGVIWSYCGIRAKAMDCQRPLEPVQIRDLCGTCARTAKEELGRARDVPEEKK